MRFQYSTIVGMFSVMAVVCAWFASTWVSGQIMESRIQAIAGDTAELCSEYARRRINDGHWPDPKDLYAPSCSLVNTVRAGGKRTDTFQFDPSGPWLQIELTDESLITAKVAWNDPTTRY